MWDTVIFIEENGVTNIMKENINVLKGLLRSEIMFVSNLKNFNKYLACQENYNQTFFGIAKLNVKHIMNLFEIGS